jgi:hypothetical protein
MYKMHLLYNTEPNVAFVSKHPSVLRDPFFDVIDFIDKLFILVIKYTPTIF